MTPGHSSWPGQLHIWLLDLAVKKKMEPRRQERAHGPHTRLQLIFTYELKDCNLRTQTKAYSCTQADLGTSCLRTRQRTAGVYSNQRRRRRRGKNVYPLAKYQKTEETICHTERRSFSGSESFRRQSAPRAKVNTNRGERATRHRHVGSLHLAFSFSAQEGMTECLRLLHFHSPQFCGQTATGRSDGQQRQQ